MRAFILCALALSGCTTFQAPPPETYTSTKSSGEIFECVWRWAILKKGRSDIKNAATESVITFTGPLNEFMVFIVRDTASGSSIELRRVTPRTEKFNIQQICF